jgi:hypothetical protein
MTNEIKINYSVERMGEDVKVSANLEGFEVEGSVYMEVDEEEGLEFYREDLKSDARSDLIEKLKEIKEMKDYHYSYELRFHPDLDYTDEDYRTLAEMKVSLLGKNGVLMKSSSYIGGITEEDLHIEYYEEDLKREGINEIEEKIKEMKEYLQNVEELNYL